MSPIMLLQNRAWLLHWSLFAYFKSAKGLDGFLELCFQQACVAGPAHDGCCVGDWSQG